MITSTGDSYVTALGRSVRASTLGSQGVAVRFEHHRGQLEPTIARRTVGRSRLPSAHDRLDPLVALPSPRRGPATVLFVDVKSSLELSASVALEDWWSMICGLFDLMCVGVHQFGGWIANFTGDGIAAIFDDRTKATAHAEQCCEAALWLRAAIKGPADRLLREYGLELAVRIGMHSGEILTGPVTGPRYRCYTASGFSVSLAKRIEGLALPGHIYISEDTAKLLPSTVELRSLGSFNVRGAAAPVSVFELLGVRR